MIDLSISGEDFFDCIEDVIPNAVASYDVSVWHLIFSFYARYYVHYPLLNAVGIVFVCQK